MKTTQLFLAALLGLALLAPPAHARRHGGALAAAAVIGTAAALSSHHHHHHGYYGGYYRPYGYYRSGYYGSYYDPYYAPRVYGAPVVLPTAGVPMVPGAVSYIDEGDFRNYRDAYGNYIGRVPLGSIPAGRW